MKVNALYAANAPAFCKDPRQIKSGENFTPAMIKPSLSLECYNGVLNALLDVGVDGGGPDGWEGEHAVELAAAKGYMGVCARLVSNGEGGRVLRLEPGITALHTACERGDLSLVKMLCGMVRERHGDQGVLKAMR